MSGRSLLQLRLQQIGFSKRKKKRIEWSVYIVLYTILNARLALRQKDTFNQTNISTSKTSLLQGQRPEGYNGPNI